MATVLRPVLVLLISVLLAACVSLVAPYDPQFDQDLNKFSQDTAKFTAAAAAGGPERLGSSSQAVAYYSGSYNVLDRLSQRAALKRGRIPCIGNEALMEFSVQPTSQSPLPADYLSFDCLEAQLYYVRFYLDQLAYGQRTGGVLNKGEVAALSTPLQASIMGAIQTFLASKP